MKPGAPIAFEPLDERVTDGTYFLVRTCDDRFHCAARFDGVWRYGQRAACVPGEVTGFVPRGVPA